MVLLAGFLLMAVGTGCVEPVAPVEWEPDGPLTLTLQVNAPSASLMTKSPDAQVDAQGFESTLHDLWLWVFNGSETVGTPYHKDSFDADDENGASITLTIPASLIKNNVTTLDVYAAGNGPSVGFTGGTNLTPTQLQNQAISGDNAVTGFGKAFVTPSDLGNKGLPMSYRGTVDISFLKHGFTTDQLSFVSAKAQSAPGNAYVLNGDSGLTVSDDQATFIYSKTDIHSWKDLDNMLNPKVQLVRAVSKVRFLFAEETKLTEKNITIESIQLGQVSNGTITSGVIPEKSYLFAGAFDNNWVDGFTWSGTPLLADDDLLKVDLPTTLRSDSQAQDSYSGKSPSNMSAQEYEDFLARKWGTSQKGLKTCYLRESSRPIQGVIHYTVTDLASAATTAKTVTFDLSPISPEGFRRNLSNLVYVYFDSGKRELVVDVKVLPWTYNVTGVTVAKDDSNTLKVDQDGSLIVEPLNTRIDYNNPLVVDGEKVYLVPLPEVPQQGAALKVYGHMIVYAPVGGTLRIKPVVISGSLSSFILSVKGKTTEELDPAKGYMECPIDRNYDKGRIYVYVSRANNDPGELELSFDAVTKDGRVINADSEIIDDRYRFVISSTTTTP